jgi:hypothetical protein
MPHAAESSGWTITPKTRRSVARRALAWGADDGRRSWRRKVVRLTIGQAVLTTLLPARRLRYSNPQRVNGTTSRYHSRDDRGPALSTGTVAINIAAHTPPPHPTPSAQPRHPSRCSSGPPEAVGA